MHDKNLDHEILKLIEAQPDIKEGEIACKLSIPEELVKIRIANFKGYKGENPNYELWA